jgi:hypothetical protein
MPEGLQANKPGPEPALEHPDTDEEKQTPRSE